VLGHLPFHEIEDDIGTVLFPLGHKGFLRKLALRADGYGDVVYQSAVDAPELRDKIGQKPVRDFPHRHDFNQPLTSLS